MRLHAFRALNRGIRSKRRDVFWTKTTWGLGELHVPGCTPCSLWRAKEIPGNNPREFLNAISNDGFLPIRKLELHFTLHDKTGMRPRLSITASKKSIIHIRTAPWMSNSASNGRHGAVFLIRRRRLGRLPRTLYFHCVSTTCFWMFPRRMHQMECILESAWYDK